MTTKYNQSAHATLKQAPMKPARDIIKTTKPTTRSGVCRKLSHVVLLLAIHSPPPMMGIDAKRVNKFKKPITVLLNLYMILSSLSSLCCTHCCCSSLSLSLSLFTAFLLVVYSSAFSFVSVTLLFSLLKASGIQNACGLCLSECFPCIRK